LTQRNLEKGFKPITYKTAFRMLNQIRIAMVKREIEQIDETYAGGRPRKTNAVPDKEGNVIVQPK
jgi:hypothetical protein